MESLRERLVDMVRIMLGRPPKHAEGLEELPDEPRWRPPGPEEERALVPLGPPKKPMPSSAVALPLPEHEIRDVDAIGPTLPDEPDGEGVQNARSARSSPHPTSLGGAIEPTPPLYVEPVGGAGFAGAASRTS